MTSPTRNDAPAVFDLPLHAAHERIADLQATAAERRAIAATRPAGRSLARLRDTMGGWLIALGAAVATDEALRRRPAARP